MLGLFEQRVVAVRASGTDKNFFYIINRVGYGCIDLLLFLHQLSPTSNAAIVLRILPLNQLGCCLPIIAAAAHEARFRWLRAVAETKRSMALACKSTKTQSTQTMPIPGLAWGWFRWFLTISFFFPTCMC